MSDIPMMPLRPKSNNNSDVEEWLRNYANELDTYAQSNNEVRPPGLTLMRTDGTKDRVKALKDHLNKYKEQLIEYYNNLYTKIKNSKGKRSRRKSRKSRRKGRRSSRKYFGLF